MKAKLIRDKMYREKNASQNVVKASFAECKTFLSNATKNKHSNAF